MVVATGSATVERNDRPPFVNWQLEFSPDEVRLPWSRRILPVRPIVGVMAASNGSLYAYGGGRVERPLGAHWLLGPSFAAGLYYADEGKRLGGVVEFRSGIELSRRLVGGAQVGVVFFHMSNGNFYRNNPGTESLLFTYRTRLR